MHYPIHDRSYLDDDGFSPTEDNFDDEGLLQEADQIVKMARKDRTDRDRQPHKQQPIAETYRRLDGSGEDTYEWPKIQDLVDAKWENHNKDAKTESPHKKIKAILKASQDAALKWLDKEGVSKEARGSARKYLADSVANTDVDYERREQADALERYSPTIKGLPVRTNDE